MGFKNKKKDKEYRRQYYQNNKAKILARAKAWNEEHPEQININKIRFFENHPDYWRKHEKN